jgi:hypothetical protein
MKITVVLQDNTSIETNDVDRSQYELDLGMSFFTLRDADGDLMLQMPFHNVKYVMYDYN